VNVGGSEPALAIGFDSTEVQVPVRIGWLFADGDSGGVAEDDGNDL